ncbi:hypothetical protein B296_00045221 [Ensete ventricosum]|uniref:Uncharacterized protein n=1 Tax=Ensete ventricosum TaxID=4639 RepID=A0A426YD55_ENSVE|nr:hypothetical protein B296_00045221 [Ensete ventricosum]
MIALYGELDHHEWDHQRLGPWLLSDGDRKSSDAKGSDSVSVNHVRVEVMGTRSPSVIPSCTGVRSCTEQYLRQFSGSGSMGPMTTDTTSRVVDAISGLAYPDCRVAEVVVHMVPRLTRRG